MDVVVRQLPPEFDPPEHAGQYIITDVGSQEKKVGPFLDQKEARQMAGYHGWTVVEE